MKKTFTLLMLLLSMISVTGLASHPIKPLNHSAAKKNYTYRLRVGFKDVDGRLLLNTTTDSPGFSLTNIETDEVSFYGFPPSQGSFLPNQTPGIINGISAGTYAITAERGQGNWVGYGSVTVTLNDDLVDEDGYITVYIPIAWAE